MLVDYYSMFELFANMFVKILSYFLNSTIICVKIAV